MYAYAHSDLDCCKSYRKHTHRCWRSCIHVRTTYMYIHRQLCECIHHTQTHTYLCIHTHIRIRHRSGTSYCFPDYERQVAQNSGNNIGAIVCNNLCYQKILRHMTVLAAAQYGAELFVETAFDNICTLKGSTTCFDVMVSGILRRVCMLKAASVPVSWTTPAYVALTNSCGERTQGCRFCSSYVMHSTEIHV
jgi:hypothetical protein